MPTPLINLGADDNGYEGGGSSSDDEQETVDLVGLPVAETTGSPSAEDKELKTRLLNKYSGYLSSLWKELSRKKKKGKLPRDARQKLLHWWQLHYMWPYPSVRNRIIHTSADLDHAGRPNEIMSAVAAAAWSITASLFFLDQGGMAQFRLHSPPPVPPTASLHDWWQRLRCLNRKGFCTLFARGRHESVCMESVFRNI